MTARVAARSPVQRPASRRRRAGFTLIELMIVIVIIVILIAILVPAIGAVMQNARESQVKQEIGQLEYALADFKAHYGVNPPSYIDFRIVDGQLLSRTQQILRRMWPNINLTNPSSTIPVEIQGRVLEGETCLVFFLGGMYDPSIESFIGFSTNPRSPFTTTGKRVGPFFEFEKGRLLRDSDGAPIGYLDPLPDQKVPYYYVTSDRYGAFQPGAPLPTTAPLLDEPPLPPKIVYFQGAPSGGSFNAASAYNAQSFQIISAGPDGATGYDPDGSGGPFVPSTPPKSTPDQGSYEPGWWGVGGHFDPEKRDTLAASAADADNITNFHGGRLYP